MATAYELGKAASKYRTAIYVIGGLLGMSLLSAIIAGVQGGKPAPAVAPPDSQAIAEAKSAKAQTERDYQTVKAGARRLKSSAKNPASFDLEQATLTQNGTLCYRYRATNSFNAIVPGIYISAGNKSSTDPRDWAVHCAGMPGEDFADRVRRVL